MSLLKNLDEQQIETAKPLSKYELRRIEKEKAIPVSFLYECFDADYGNGTLKWKERPASHFKNESAHKNFNARYPGTPALHCDMTLGYKAGAVTINGTRYTIMAHRTLFAMKNNGWPCDEVDHINHDKTDNRLKNLRVVTRRVNSKNQKMRSDNTSGVTGVKWDKKTGKWVAQIKSEGKAVTLQCPDTGKAYFEHKIDAIYARYYAEQDYGYHANHGRG